MNEFTQLIISDSIGKMLRIDVSTEYDAVQRVEVRVIGIDRRGWIVVEHEGQRRRVDIDKVEKVWRI